MLKERLKKSGLENTEFWLTEFKKLGVTTIEAFEELKRDKSVFSKLKSKAEHQVEKNALRKLLEIDELEREEEQKSQKRRTAQEELASKEKRQHDERIRNVESRAYKSLAISPDTSTNTLNELLREHKSDHGTSGVVQLREKLGDSMLLQKCSGGLALQGILWSQQLEDRMGRRSQLLEIPEDVSLSGAAEAEDTIETFTSIHKEHEYQKKVSVLGVGFAVSGSAAYGGVTLSGGVSTSYRKEDERESEEHEKKTYSSTVKHSELQVASYSFAEKDLKLCTEVKEYLKNISLVYQSEGGNADSGKVYEACIRFFEKYGSHVNIGPLTFGGRFWWTCSNEGFNSKKRQTVEEMQSFAISTSAGVSFAGVGVSTKIDYDNVQGKYKGHSLEETIASTKLDVKITGGPPQVTDIAKWKNGLVENNSTWILIDRGEKLMPVWDIIKLNHEVEFGHLSKLMSSSWERKTGLTAQQDLLDFATSKGTLARVGKWNENKQPTVRQIQERIECLLKVKKEIIDKVSNSRFWIGEYLAHPTLQEFFLSIINPELDCSHSEHIKFMMKQLVEKEELDQLNTMNFPAIEEFSEWLYKTSQQPQLADELQNEIVDFTSFIDFLKQTEILQPGSKVTNEALTHTIEKGIRRLQVLYEKTYNDVLTSILLYPYRSGYVGNYMQLKPLSFVDLRSLTENFSEQREKFESNEGNMLHLQSYLLLLAMDQYYMMEVTQFQDFMREVGQMMNELQPPLEKELSLQLSSHLCGPTLMTEFRQSLLSLMKSPDQKYPELSSVSANDRSLKIALQTLSHEPEAMDDSQAFLWGNSNAHALLEKLGLRKYYPKKLTLRGSLCIRTEVLKLSLNGIPPTNPQQLPFLVLHKLMCYDSKCRSDLMSTDHISSTSIKEVCDNKCVDSDDDYVDSDEDDEEENTKQLVIPNGSLDGVHPVDCLLALFFCSDEFLLQDLFSRLAKCQLAVPFILPNPSTSRLTLPLWALCPIVKDWRSLIGNKVVEKTHSVVSYPMPIVSFIRIGRKKQIRGASKSKILNDVISDSHHDFFIHYNCPGGKYDRVLGEGLVDMSWYLPAGKPTDYFSDAITFLNLHGDARDHPDQCRFLSQISSMCFVLLTEEDLKIDSQIMDSLKKFYLSPGGFAILNDVKKNPKALKKEFAESPVINITGKSDPEIKSVIRKRINKQKITYHTDLRSIEDCCVGERSILFDEEREVHREGHKCANKLKSIIRQHGSGVKEAMLPLQGEILWKAWAAKDKEQHRHNDIGKEDENEYDAYIDKMKSSIRMEQLKHVKVLSPVTESLIQSLLSLEGPGNRSQRNYFLQCLKLELNSLSRESISKLQHQYHFKRKELSLLQAGSDPEKAGKCINLKRDLKVLRDKIVESSCGLEHLLRELGQVYEAALASKEYGDGDVLSRLPRAVAELLIDGHPLELMDGDAAHVPLQWVTAVLREAVNILGNPKVFVLSVLGLQSTGKSTMLNTTFGVQFNVSAGRCTRGAYIQLLQLSEEIPLGEEIQKKNYVLLVDTEGLRAPELDPQKICTHTHDNVIATFVIGLANTTLININGEVPGNMDDILQTSVYAFLRMTRIDIHPSCQFVHQNASVNIKGDVGRAMFAEKLNNFTRDAAKEERCEGQCESFNDVIKFNDNTDVHYFPGLWKGGPPMAPVDEEYSAAAQLLKQRVVEIICNGAGKSVLSLSSFQMRMSDLWNMLLKEKFVFSFKNGLEIFAYNSLEAAYSKWEWTFREAMLKWEQKAENEILPKPPPPADEVAKLVGQKLENLQDTVLKLHDTLAGKMAEFFKGEQSEILVQWKKKFEIRLDNLSKVLISHAEEFCNGLLSSRNAIAAFETDRQNYSKMIKAKVEQHIKRIKQEQLSLDSSLEERQLTEKQLKRLLRRNLFSVENLTKYEEQGLITPAQKGRINDIKRGELTESTLSEVLVGGVLAVEQVKKILREMKQTEKELKTEFEDIWSELTSKLYSLSKPPVPVETEVQNAVKEFARGKSYEGQYIAKIRKKNLTQWGDAKPDFIPKEKFHYKKAVGFINNLKNKYPCRDEALKVTQQVFHEVHVYVQHTTAKDTDFNPSFTTELLLLVDKKIADSEKLASVSELLTFTLDYRIEMYLYACGYALPRFKIMAKLFKTRNDPLIYLEEHEKDPLFSKFKNQYHQTEAEEAIANTLCAYFKNPMKEQIDKLLSLTMVTKMKDSEKHFFSSKRALKVKVLTDLHEEGKFQGYMVYVRDVGRCLREHIKRYTVKYCDEKVSGESTRIQRTAKYEVTHLVGVIENVVADINERNTFEWLSSFCKHKKLRSELGVTLEPNDMLSGHDSSQDLDLDNFQLKIRTGLENLKIMLHDLYDNIKCETEMVHWKVEPHQHLSDLVGCIEQCPLCKEQCDLKENHDGKHRTEIHRPDCLGGFAYRGSDIMTTHFCPVLVAGDMQFYKSATSDTQHDYSKYYEVYPDWTIPPDKSATNSLYWKWFVAEYSEDIAKEFNAKPPPVPLLWSTYTHKDKWPEVEKDLKAVYKI